MEEIFIYEEDIKDFFFEKLLAAGLCPDGGDLDIISSIVFDYLIELGIIDEEVEEDDDE